MAYHSSGSIRHSYKTVPSWTTTAEFHHAQLHFSSIITEFRSVSSYPARGQFHHVESNVSFIMSRNSLVPSCPATSLMSSYRSVHYDHQKVSPSGPTTAQFHHTQLLVSSIMTYYRQFYHGLPPQHILSWPGIGQLRYDPQRTGRVQ
jgi:hypothetical protein